MMPLKNVLMGYLCCLLLSGCGASLTISAGDPLPNDQPTDNTAPDPAPPLSQGQELSVLLMGNSHTASHDLPGLLENLLTLHNPNASIVVSRAEDSLYLFQHLESPNTLATFNQRQWSHVILQAQRYSQSRSRLYPTEAAQQWIANTKAQGGIPILFPEWGQVGRDWEGPYVYDLHSGIADQEAACVAPIGFAWDTALTIRPDLSLHAADGNHASLTGAFLTALVLFESITGYAADLLPAIEGLGIPAQTQDFLGQMASQAIADYPPCTRLE